LLNSLISSAALSRLSAGPQVPQLALYPCHLFSAPYRCICGAPSYIATRPIATTIPTRWSDALGHTPARLARPPKPTLAPHDTHHQPYTPHQLQPQHLHLGYVPNRLIYAAAAMHRFSMVYWAPTRYTGPLQCTLGL
jgi:hypothetical protein